jgi:protein-S-isoprenylcysteine O-methyltransferase Ste14
MAESTARRVSAILGSIAFLAIAPGVVAGAVPRWISRWRFQPPLLGLPGVRIAGGILVAAGVLALLDSFARFALQGIGTPAPVFPTKHLVVSGQYRYVRNPMYVAVVSAILGQALLFGDVRLLEYGALVWLAFHAFVLAVEEPMLRHSFGAEYAGFCANVPRWLPRRSAWRATPGPG